MSTTIPTYQLNTLTKPEGDAPAVFFMDHETVMPVVPIHLPYRSNYYKIGVCLRGSATLKANLETYAITPDCLVVLPTTIIKQWPFMSDDYDLLSVFFTRDVITAHTGVNPDTFQFFDSMARHAFQLSATQARTITASLTTLRQTYDTPHLYKNEILKSLLAVLLYEIASIYDQQQVVSTATQTRGQLLVADFKKLVHVHCSAERSLPFYAEKLSITPKHLTETVKAVTGKTAGEWIAEAVMLEARVLLQNPSLTIAQISDTLHFADQSTFGRFFKKSIGLSPVAYKQAL